MQIKLYQKILIYNFFKILIEVAGVFVALIFIMGLLEEVSFFNELDQTIFYPILLTLLNLPSVLYDIFPFIFIIATQFFFIRMVDKSELSLFKNNGISNLKIISFKIVRFNFPTYLSSTDQKKTFRFFCKGVLLHLIFDIINILRFYLITQSFIYTHNTSTISFSNTFHYLTNWSPNVYPTNIIIFSRYIIMYYNIALIMTFYMEINLYNLI